MYVSPLSKGLFHKFITFSGCGSTPFLHNDRDSTIYARAFAKSFGVDIDESAENILKELNKFQLQKL